MTEAVNTLGAATAAEIVSAIQREALIHAGLPPLTAHLQNHSGKAERFRQLAREDVSGDSPAEHPFVRYGDLSGLLVRIPTAYQDPFIYAWLEDFWAYHSKVVYRQTSHPAPVFLIASAATGQFNARAIPASDQPAILLEDGLIFFAHRVSHILAPLLFHKLDDGCFATRESQRQPELSSPQHLASTELAGLVLDYLLHGTVPAVPPVVAAAEDNFSIRYVVFTSLIAFVFEHELHHLREAREGQQAPTNRKVVAQQRFEALWGFTERAFRDETRVEFDRTRMERLFHAHLEEHFADLRALLTVIHLGREDKTLVPSVDGALLFFFLADAIDYARRSIADPDAHQAMKGMRDIALVLNGLVLEESHPYPHMRLKALLETREVFSPSLKKLLQEETETLEAIFETVKHILSRTIGDRRLQPVDIHPKWTFNVGSLLR